MTNHSRKPPRFGDLKVTSRDGTFTVKPALTASQMQEIPGVAVKLSAYETYIRSSAWRRVRQRYINSKLPKVCAGCKKPWGKGDHLHHRTYKNFGAERLMDLVPLCEPCHSAVHRLYDSDPKWKRKGLWYATKAITNKR